MHTPIVGLHHVTAIASDPQRNLDFYTQVLGLRFVKRTVNFDDPETHHFYFGDDIGSPGTLLTFFPWPNATRGSIGVGETIATAFSIPAGTLEYWKGRLGSKNIAFNQENRFDSPFLKFSDPDGMVIELVQHPQAVASLAPRYSDVPAEKALQGLWGTTLLEAKLDRTDAMLATIGYRQIRSEGNRFRYSAGGNTRGHFIDIVLEGNARPGRMGAGTVHHIAFRIRDDAAQLEWQSELSREVRVTSVQDSTYFHSIYFREPGGVLFEIATDSPGFLIDEPEESLGETLCIPAWLEPRREAIENRIPPITLHRAVRAGIAAHW